MSATWTGCRVLTAWVRGTSTSRRNMAPRCRSAYAAGIAKPRGVRKHGPKHGLQLAQRAADHSEHFRRRCLLLQRFPQLSQQPGILDRDDGLAREVRDQCYLLVRKWPDFLPVNDDGTDQLVLLEHRHGDGGSRATERGCQARNRFSGGVWGAGHLLCPHYVIEPAAWYRFNRSAPLLGFDHFW